MAHRAASGRNGQVYPKWFNRGTGSADWIASMIIRSASRFGS
jgi:hypothetical protein